MQIGLAVWFGSAVIQLTLGKGVGDFVSWGVVLWAIKGLKFGWWDFIEWGGTTLQYYFGRSRRSPFAPTTPRTDFRAVLSGAPRQCAAEMMAH